METIEDRKKREENEAVMVGKISCAVFVPQFNFIILKAWLFIFNSLKSVVKFYRHFNYFFFGVWTEIIFFPSSGRLICCSNGCGRECVAPLNSFPIKAEKPILPFIGSICFKFQSATFFYLQPRIRSASSSLQSVHCLLKSAMQLFHSLRIRNHQLLR